jgi:hypothetical protein
LLSHNCFVSMSQLCNLNPWLKQLYWATDWCILNLIERTNKMRPCSRIYYSNVSKLFNMFRTTHRPSSGAQNCNCSLWFNIRLWLPTAAMAQPWQLPATKNVCKTRDCNTVFELLMMGRVSPETCWATNKHLNNKFYYTVASCWFFPWDLYYDARIQEHLAYFTCTKIVMRSSNSQRDIFILFPAVSMLQIIIIIIIIISL